MGTKLKNSLKNQRKGGVFICTRKSGKGSGAEQGLVKGEQEEHGYGHIWTWGDLACMKCSEG